MLLVYILIELVLIASSRANRPDPIKEAREIRIPFTERVLNSVLGRLERTRQERREMVSSDAEDEPALTPEYTESLQEDIARERQLRKLVVEKHYPICHLQRKIRRLNTYEYEYRPAYYEEVLCISRPAENNETNEICSSLGFSCVQLNKTIHLTRRRYTSDCWETKTMLIPGGCECMWPHGLGEINIQL